jgi:hypothetical protein
VGKGGVCGPVCVTECQVCTSFDSNLGGLLEEQGPAALASAKATLTLRHRLFVKRKRDASETVSWRPVKRYRTAAKSWLLNLDNQVSGTLAVNGLASFVPPAAREGIWANWRSWRHLLISIDQGSDGICATNYLKHLKANVTIYCDWSHGANNDFSETLRAMGLFPYWLLMLIVFNVEHGPFADDMRWNQVEEAWRELRKHYDAKSCELFQYHCPRMKTELERGSLLPGGADGDPEVAVWEFLDQAPPFHKKGSKTQLSRFQAARRKAASFLPVWSAKLFQCEYCAIESGFMNSAKLGKLTVRDPALNPDGTEASTTTNPGHISVCEKALRSTCQNSLVISCVMLEDYYHAQLMKIIVACSDPVEEWHSLQNKTLRDTESSKRWLPEQLDGGFWKHVRDIMSKLRSRDLLEDIGFELSLRVMDNLAALLESELAEVFGDFALCLGSKRVVRCLWFLRGWPSRMVGVLGTEQLAMSTMGAFKDDLEAWEALASAPEPSKAMQNVLKRSVFNETSVQQYVEVACNIFNHTSLCSNPWETNAKT